MRYPLILRAFAFGFVVVMSDTVQAIGGMVMTEPVSRIAPTESRMHEMCGSGRFDACTLFVGFALTGDCTGDGSIVRMRVSAHVTPLIILQNIRKLPHEQEHIHDVAQALAIYISDLEATSFRSSEECRAAALDAQSTFGERIRHFARASSSRMNEPLR